MPPSRPSRFRKLAGFAGVSTAALLGSAFFAGAASAHHPEVSVTTDCTGVVDFTSTAWAPATDAQRTNPEIGVAYKVDAGSFVNLPQKAEYRYDKANGFSFSDEIGSLPAGWHQVTVKVTAIGEWGSGYQGPDSREASVIAPDDCATPAQPSATVATPTCEAGGATVTLKNEGDDDAVFDVNGTEYTVDATKDVFVPFPGDTPTDITVTSGSYAKTFEDLEYHCAAPIPAASLSSSCAEGGAVVHLANTGDEDTTFTVKVPGQPDQVVPVAKGGSEDVTVPLAEDSTTAITITSTGMDDKTETVTYDCTTPAPPAPPVDNTPVVVPPAPEQPTFVAPEVVVPVVEVPVVSVPVSSSAAAPATVEATPAPVPTPQGEVLAAEATAPAAAPSSATLPFTGNETGPLALTAFGSLLAGLAMVFAGRRRTTQQ